MMMFAPILRENEHIYSVESRFHLLSANQSQRSTSLNLTGNDRSIPNIKFGSGLSNLSRRLGYSEDKLLNEHTYLRLYKLFTRESNYLNAEKALKKGDIQSLNRNLGLLSGELFDTNTINICPECYSESRMRYLILYHQVPGVKVCYKHGAPLKYYRTGNKIREFINLKEVLKESSEWHFIDDVQYEWSKKYAVDVYKQMKYLEVNSNRSLDDFREILYSRVFQLGYITVGGLILQKKLHTDFEEYHTVRYLREINSTFVSKRDSWLSNFILGNSVTLHPARGIAIIDFLFGSFSEFSNYECFDIDPFHKKEFQCMNKECEKAGIELLKPESVKRNPNNGGLCATLVCDCGFSYKQTALLKSETWTYSRPQITKWGGLWESKLIEISKSDLSLTKMGIELGTSKTVVKNQMLKLGLVKELKDRDVKFKMNADIKKIDHLDTNDRCLKYIQNITTYISMKSIDGLIRSDIQREMRKEYDWLMKNSPEKLDAIIPKAISHSDRNSSGKSNRRWCEKEKELMSKLDAIELEMCLESITFTRLTRILNYPTLFSTIDKMPMLKKRINRLIGVKNEDRELL